MNCKISVIIPAFNEEYNSKRGVLEEVYAYLSKKFPNDFELIIVDDGSTDHTPTIINDFAQKHPHTTALINKHQGKALTVKSGMLVAKGTYKLFTDFDQSTPIQEIEKLLPFMRKGYQIAIGSREVKGAAREKEPFHRHLMGKGFNLIVKLFTVRGIQDTQCGFKLFQGTTANDLFSRVYVTTNPKKDAFTGAFDVELLYLAQKQQLKVAEVPVIWHHNHSERVSPIKDSVRMLVEVIKIRIADLLGKYE